MNTPTAEEIAFAADVRKRDKALRVWLGKRSSYHPDDVPAELKPLPTNGERSRAECIEFRANPLPAGERYTAYLDSDRKHVTTFTGEVLATVHNITRRADAKSWLTNERGTFKATGIDGRQYRGAHNGPGIYCTMRNA